MRPIRPNKNQMQLTKHINTGLSATAIIFTTGLCIYVVHRMNVIEANLAAMGNLVATAISNDERLTKRVASLEATVTRLTAILQQRTLELRSVNGTVTQMGAELEDWTKHAADAVKAVKADANLAPLSIRPERAPRRQTHRPHRRQATQWGGQPARKSQAVAFDDEEQFEDDDEELSVGFH